MIEIQNLSKIDELVCKIVSNDAKADYDSSFLNNPTYYKSNSQTVMKEKISNDSYDDAGINTARYYEICDGSIHESFSTIEDNSSDEILGQEVAGQSDDLIVVISDDIKHEELINLYDKLKERLKFIVHYGSNLAVKEVFEHFTQIISVDSLTKAVNKSHLLAQNGQTIFFPKVSSNFDFFRHVNFA